jgi:hypothetical protein
MKSTLTHQSSKLWVEPTQTKRITIIIKENSTKEEKCP